MPNKLVFNGLDEFRADLRNLPDHLVAEGDVLADDRSELAMSEIIQRYPRRTGNLRKGVRKRKIAGGYMVENRAPHALIYEIGTQARHTKLGANRGSMPPGKVFASVAPKHRRALEDDYVALLQREGFEVRRA